jgi:hypothetical protein
VSLVADDNNYLVVRSATSGLTSYARTDFEFPDATATASRLDFSVVVKSSASSTTLRLFAFHVPTASWTLLNSSTVGTSESTKSVSVTAGAGGYRDSGGRVRLRVEGSRLLSTFTLSHEVTRLTVTP